MESLSLLPKFEGRCRFARVDSSVKPLTQPLRVFWILSCEELDNYRYPNFAVS